MRRYIGIASLLLACTLGAGSPTAQAHGGWRGGHRGGVYLGFGLGPGYPGPFLGYPYYGYPYYGPRVVVPAPAYGAYDPYGAPVPYGPPAYAGPPAYVGPQQAYVAPPAYRGPLVAGIQPGQALQPAPAVPPAQPPGTIGTAPYVCQSAALAEQLGGTDAAGTPAPGGTVVAALLAGEAGRWIDLREQACIARALELAPPGHRVAWRALATSAQFAVVAGTVEQRGERVCRSFEAEYATGSGARKAFGSACRRPDGVWVAAG